jgi:hypothetical protein
VAQNWHVYPKAVVKEDTWTAVLKVTDQDTQANHRFTHVYTSNVLAEAELRLLKVSFDLVVADTDVFQDVDDALFVDDIRPGPQVETVWGNWQVLAESLILSMGTPHMQARFWEEWRQQDTASVRSDARRSLVTQRGWTVSNVHQHEGDGTNTDE